MDQLTASRTGMDPAIREILARTRRLTADEVVALARAYVEATAPPARDVSTDPSDRAPADAPAAAPDRARILAIARARAMDRAAEIADLERLVWQALHEVGPAPARRALARIDALEHAELAIRDAVLSIALADRLGSDTAVALRTPWMVIA